MVTELAVHANGKALETYDPVSNGAGEGLRAEEPYTVEVQVEGVAPLLFHRWNNEAVEGKGKSAKGSATRKTDNVESYVSRTPEGEIAIPGEYFRMALVNAARFFQDPRSPRKSAMDLYKAAVVINEELCSLGCKEWDYLDRRRVSVQRAGVTRTRPAMRVGWRATFTLTVLTPEYLDRALVHEVLEKAGRLVGVGDFRPTYGRFMVLHFRLTDE